MSRKVKSVSFNQNDPFENEMYEYSKRFPNFSSFIKRLILNAMNEKSDKVQSFNPSPRIEKSSFEQVVISPDYLRQLI